MLENCPLCDSKTITQLPFGSRQSATPLFIAECGACSHRFILEPPSDDQLKKSYDTFFASDVRQEKHVASTPRDRALVWRLKRSLPVGAKVLDIGANFGETLLAFPKHCKLEGVELSASAAGAALKNSRLTIYNDFFENLDLPIGTYDCVISMAVIEHLRHPMDFLNKIATLLKPGGISVIMTGDYSSWEAQHLGADWPLYHSGGHLHFFNERSLLLAMSKAGLIAYDRMWAGPTPLTSRLPSKFARFMHCQTATLLFPFIFGRRKYGDLLYVWCKRE